MGRAYEVRKASIQKTGAARGKLYSMYAKEIYLSAKNGGTSMEANASLKRLVERAKKEQVPGDIIKRAIDKVNSGVDDSYQEATYEMFGPAGSTLIVDCLTDNLNRSVSSLRAVVNKCHIKMGSIGSVSYNYDNLCIVGVKDLNEEDVMDKLIENDIDIQDIETEDGIVVIYGNPQDLFKIKDVISINFTNVQFEIDEISKLPKEKVTLSGEDLDTFKRVLDLLDEVEDVQHVYHNVQL
ncbi:MAG: YebC/PmpR family DNA-binding transcriptional regulator [Clostridium sp.]|nr:YebC/PmpR family DNA-binding transcriptional regulator [Clostridium sp.]MCM1444411.1 YebC/PmpR family DNA-binding transcriptional regulator [Candidatus Amulumruptor caecigallinarius]